ncbi:energy transducer TonB [Geitlerinema splendidum]|jgi:TonB family protein|nr:energy transducer TonB [Geitlerinema splendidum]
MISRLTPGIFSFCLHSLFLGAIILISWKKGNKEENPIHVIWMEKKIEKILSQNPMKQEKQKKKKSIKPALTPQKMEAKNLQQAVDRLEAKPVNQKPLPKNSYQPLPTYPWVCRKRGQEGVVAIFIRTNNEGRVIDTKVQTSSGYDLLDEAALKAIQNWILAEGCVEKTFSIAFRLNG